MMDGDELLAHLKQIAALVSRVSPDQYSTEVHLSDDLVDALTEMQTARRSKTVYSASDLRPEPYVIECVDVVIDGVRFHAQHARTATLDEASRLTGAAPRVSTRVMVSL